MSHLDRRFAAIALVLSTALAGCSSFTSPRTRVSGSTVPALKVVADCRGCELPSDVVAAIADAYASAAREARTTVDPDNESTLVVTAFGTRSVLFMLIAGPLAVAFTDEIRGYVTRDGKRMDVEHVSRTPVPFGRVGSMARSMGEKSFEALNR